MAFAGTDLQSVPISSAGADLQSVPILDADLARIANPRQRRFFRAYFKC